MTTHDLRRCSPKVGRSDEMGVRVLIPACRCVHSMRPGDFVLIPEGGAQGARYSVLADLREHGASNERYALEYSPRTMREVQSLEAADAKRISGGRHE